VIGFSKHVQSFVRRENITLMSLGFEKEAPSVDCRLWAS
jgi:hypothetical protein